MPACSAEAGEATVSLEVIGTSRVNSTPTPKAAIIINITSGLLFTLYSLHVAPGTALFGAIPTHLSLCELLHDPVRFL